jgi:hypothetical protein
MSTDTHFVRRVFVRHGRGFAGSCQELIGLGYLVRKRMNNNSSAVDFLFVYCLSSAESEVGGIRRNILALLKSFHSACRCGPRQIVRQTVTCHHMTHPSPKRKPLRFSRMILISSKHLAKHLGASAGILDLYVAEDMVDTRWSCLRRCLVSVAARQVCYGTTRNDFQLLATIGSERRHKTNRKITPVSCCLTTKVLTYFEGIHVLQSSPGSPPQRRSSSRTARTQNAEDRDVVQ